MTPPETNVRAYTVEPFTGHNGRAYGFTRARYSAFRLHLTGDGHWTTARGCDPGGLYFDRASAERAGRAWVETGRAA